MQYNAAIPPILFSDASAVRSRSFGPLFISSRHDHVLEMLCRKTVSITHPSALRQTVNAVFKQMAQMGSSVATCIPPRRGALALTYWYRKSLVVEEVVRSVKQDGDVAL